MSFLMTSRGAPPTLPHHIVPVFTYASLTRQLTAAEMARYFADVKPWGLTSAHLAGTTVRLTHDNRVFVRNTYDFISSLKSSGDHLNVAWRNHRQAFESRFPFITFNQLTLTFNAAVEKLGVSLAWDSMARQAINNGTLKRLGDFHYETGNADYLVKLHNRPLTVQAAKLYDWLLNAE